MQPSIEWQMKYSAAKEELFRQFNAAVREFDTQNGIVRSKESKGHCSQQVLELVYELMMEFPREEASVCEALEVPDLGDEDFPNLCLHSVE